MIKQALLDKVSRGWHRIKCGCITKHRGDRLRVHRDGDLLYQCSECHLEIHHVLPGQELRVKPQPEPAEEQDDKILRFSGRR